MKIKAIVTSDYIENGVYIIQKHLLNTLIFQDVPHYLSIRKERIKFENRGAVKGYEELYINDGDNIAVVDNSNDFTVRIFTKISGKRLFNKTGIA